MIQYYILLDNKKQGPYNSSELEELDINSNTLIWSKGMDDWKKASDIEELNVILENLPPPLPTRKKTYSSYLKKNSIYIIIILIICIIIWHVIYD